MKKYLLSLLLLAPVCGFSQGNYLDVIQVADSIYVFKPKIDWVNSNCTAVIGKNGIFIIDTFMQTNYADEAIDKLKKISPLPVQYVFNTHGHTDHIMGNPVFKAAYPQCKLIMNDSTVRKYPKNIKYGDIKTFTGEIPTLEKELANKKMENGYALTEPLQEFWKWQIREAKEYDKSYKSYKPVYPDIVFSQKLKLYFGGHEIVLMRAEGEGHDVGDAVVWLPRQKILLAGDIVVGPTPYAIRGRVTEMIRSLQQIIEMNPSTVIPGHGDVMKGLTYVKNELELFTTIQKLSLEAIAQGISYKDAVAKISIPTELEERFTNGDDVREWAMKSFFTVWTINGTYKQNKK